MKAKKRITLVLMAAVLAVSCMSYYTPESSATLNSEYLAVEKKISQMKDKLASLGDDRKNIEQRLKENESAQNEMLEKKALLDGRIEIYQEEIDLTEEYIAGLEDQIDVKEQLIAANEQTEREKYEIFKKRVRAMHEDGTVSYIGVVLGAENFYDLLSRIEVIERLVDYDDKVITDLVDTRNGIISQKTELEQDKSEKDGVMADLLLLKRDLDDQLAEQVAIINNLQAEEEKDIKAYEAAEAEQERINSEIKKQTAELAKISKYVGGNLGWPIPGYYTVTSPYGMRMHPVLKKWSLHTGTDIGAPKGVKIVAMNSGTILFSGYSSGYGNYITIDHGGGYVTLYAHMSKRAAEKGNKVKKGDVIGYVGSTGYSTGPHLHFEVIINGNTTDPMKNFK